MANLLWETNEPSYKLESLDLLKLIHNLVIQIISNKSTIKSLKTSSLNYKHNTKEPSNISFNSDSDYINSMLIQSGQKSSTQSLENLEKPSWWSKSTASQKSNSTIQQPNISDIPTEFNASDLNSINHNELQNLIIAVKLEMVN